MNICKAKCPCCGRICGKDDNHPYHQCVFGHQMRGFNGNYIQRKNNVKEASVIRCEQIKPTDPIKFNGIDYTWMSLKQYWKEK